MLFLTDTLEKNDSDDMPDRKNETKHSSSITINLPNSRVQPVVFKSGSMQSNNDDEEFQATNEV